MTTKKEHAGVNSVNFRRWAEQFVSATAHLRDDNKKMLLIMDGYRSNCGLDVLVYLESKEVICYALPYHTSGLTQPLDVGVFGPFKMYWAEKLRLRVFADGTDQMYNMYDVCRLLTTTYYKAFSQAKRQFIVSCLRCVRPLVP